MKQPLQAGLLMKGVATSSGLVADDVFLYYIDGGEANFGKDEDVKTCASMHSCRYVGQSLAVTWSSCPL